MKVTMDGAGASAVLYSGRDSGVGGAWAVVMVVGELHRPLISGHSVQAHSHIFV